MPLAPKPWRQVKGDWRPPLRGGTRRERPPGRTKVRSPSKARPPPPPPGASSSVLPVGVTATATVARGFAAQHSLAIVGGGHRQVTARGYHPSILAAVAAIAASQGAIVAQQARRAEVEFLNAEQAAGGGDQEAVHAEYEPPEPLGELPYQEADDP